MSHVIKVRPVAQEEVVQQVIGEKAVQTIVRAKIPVPKKKPAVEQILTARAQVVDQEVEIIPDKVIVQGKIAVHVTYVADFPTQPVHHLRAQLEFAESVHIPGARPGMDVVKQITIEKVRAEVDPADPRQIIITIILRIFVKVVQVEPKKLLIDIVGAENRFVREKVVLDVVKAIGEKQIVVSEQVDILQLFQGKKPCPKEVIDVIADVMITKKEIIPDKVIVEGVLTVQVIYVADFPSQPVHHAHIEIPFVAFVDLPGVRPGDIVNVRVEIEDVAARVKNDCELAITAVLKITARVIEQIKKMIVVRIDTDLLQCLVIRQAIRETTLFLDRILNEQDQVQVTLREIVTIPKQKPPAQKILEAIVVNVQVTETTVVPNKVIVRGVITVKIVYVADQPDQPVHAFEAEIPFTAFIDVPGAMPGVDVNVMVDVEFVQAAVENDRRVAVSLVVKVTARVADIVQKKVFEVLRPNETFECPVITNP